MINSQANIMENTMEKNMGKVLMLKPAMGQ